MAKKFTEDEFAKIYNKYVSDIYVLAYSFMKNSHDAEDIVQETFIKLLNQGNIFESDGHIKAWLIVTASNTCKNVLKSSWKKNENIDDHPEIPANVSNENREILELVMKLPDKYKTVIYLYYYEGYSVAEISKTLKRNESTVRTNLARARELLKKELEN